MKTPSFHLGPAILLARLLLSRRLGTPRSYSLGELTNVTLNFTCFPLPTMRNGDLPINNLDLSIKSADVTGFNHQEFGINQQKWRFHHQKWW